MKTKKELLLAFLSEAIDKGWNIEVSSRGWGTSKTQAIDHAIEFSKITEQTIVPKEDTGTNWLVVGSAMSKLRGNFHYDGFMKEDIDLSGGEEIAV